MMHSDGKLLSDDFIDKPTRSVHFPSTYQFLNKYLFDYKLNHFKLYLQPTIGIWKNSILLSN